MSTSALASNQLVTTPPTTQTTSSDDIVVFGADEPVRDAATQDISRVPYDYHVFEVGYRVYTDKWLTGKTSMNVSIKNWTKVHNGGSTSNKLSVSIYSKGVLWGSNHVETKTFEDARNVSSVTFNNLDSSKEYYIMFEVPTNQNKFSFNGTIS